MEETAFEQSMAEEEQPTPNENVICCATCGTDIVPAHSATKIKKRVQNS